MGCVEKGELRAYLDGELAGPEGLRVEQHLVSCASCREELESLRGNALLARTALDRLAPRGAELPRPNWSRVRDRMEDRELVPVTLRREIRNMFKGFAHLLGGSRLRLAGSSIAALVMVALLFPLSPVQTMASSFLSIFRVQKFVAVTVDPKTLPDLANPGELGSFTTTGSDKARTVSLEEASKVVGFAVPTPSALPAGLEAKPRSVVVMGPHGATFTPDMDKVRAYLSSIGASDVKLPDNLDGAPISVSMPPSAQVLFLEKGGAERGDDGTFSPHVGQKFLYLGVTSSPTMNVPDGIDVELIRSELLKIPGLPADLVNQVKAIEDWRNTVVVPVVKGTSKEVTVQGEKGLMITSSEGEGTHLAWLKDGVIYAMSGSFSEAELLAAANSLK